MEAARATVATMGSGVTVAQEPLELSVQVRILASQLLGNQTDQRANPRRS